MLDRCLNEFTRALLLAALAFGVAMPADASTLKDKEIKRLLAADPPADDGRIVPGWRFGKVHLGMDSKGLLDAWGPPAKTIAESINELANLEWRDRRGFNLTVVLTKGRVTSIATYAYEMPGRSEYATVAGIALGIGALEALSMLGEPARTYKTLELPFNRLCFAEGLGVSFRKSDGVVVAIDVINPKNC